MKNKILLLFCLLRLPFLGQTVLGVDTLVKSGPIDKRINVVIMGDGFLASEMATFNAKATALTNYMFNQEPYKQYKKYFNVFAIRCVSPQSGVSHPGTATDVTEPQIPVISVANNFNTTFDNNHTHRAIVSNNSSAVYAVLAQNFPTYDQAVILGNSPEYGGTGGPYAVLSINSSAPEILIHEMGHSFAGLADEYWAGPQFATEKPNMTANNDSATVKWTQWLGGNGVGIYAYGTTAPESSWFRPHQNCKMKVLGVPYCAVCRQSVVERIHALTNPVESYTPSDSTPVALDSTLWFKTKLLKPNPNTLRTTWEINQSGIAHNKDSVLLNTSLLSPGSNALVFTAIDTTAMSRDVNHPNLHTYSVVWEVDYTIFTGIRQIKPEMEFSVFPNPATEQVNLEYTLLQAADVGIAITDMSGRALISEKSRRTAAGSYTGSVDVSALPAGSYLLALKINDHTITNKIIIVK